MVYPEKKYPSGRVRPSPKAEYYYIHFEAAYTEDRTNRLMLPVRGTFQPGLFLPLLQQLERLLNRTPCSHLELQSEFFRLLGLLYTQEQSYTPLTAGLMRYLNENYASHITGESLAETFHYSSEYIDKKMKQELGMTASRLSHLHSSAECQKASGTHRSSHSENSFGMRLLGQFHILQGI